MLLFSVFTLIRCFKWSHAVVKQTPAFLQVKNPQSCTVLIQGSTDHAVAQMKAGPFECFDILGPSWYARYG